jgi:hypothetical protein
MLFQGANSLLTQTPKSILFPSYFGGVRLENEAGFQKALQGYASLLALKHREACDSYQIGTVP